MSDHRVPGRRAPLEDANVRAARQGTVDARGVGPSGRYQLRCVVASSWQPARVPALPASACDRKRSIRGFCGHDHPGPGMAESAPCPLIAAGFCERAGGSRGAQRPRAAPQAPLTRPSGSGSCRAAGGRESLAVRDAVQRFRRAAFLCGVTSSGGRGGGARSSQPYLGPRGFGCCPGDMMIDRVSPACGDAAAQSNQAVRLAGPAAADSGSAGAGRGGPHRVSEAVPGPAGPARSRAGHRVME